MNLNALSSPQEVVIRSVGRSLGVEAGADVSPLRGQIRWDGVVELAARQGVIPLVHVGTRALGLELPEREKDLLLAGTADVMTRQQAGLNRTLGTAVSVLTENGIEPVVLKGAALAHAAYPQPWYRPLADVDLLLPQGELARASSLLLEHGFRCDGAFRASFPKVEYHLPPHYLAGSTVALELHQGLLSDPHPYRIDVDRIRERGRVVDLAGTPARIPAPVDALHHTCIHLAFAHRYEIAPLRGLADILAITRTWHDALDWDDLVATVRASRSAGAVFWPLLLARAWLGAAIPVDALEAMAPPAPVRRLLRPFLEPTFILEGRLPPERPDQALLEVLRDVSLRGGCPPGVQCVSLWRAIFRPPGDVGHLPARVTRSPLRYLAFLLNPKRIGRGVRMAGRLIVRSTAG